MLNGSPRKRVDRGNGDGDDDDDVDDDDDDAGFSTVKQRAYLRKKSSDGSAIGLSSPSSTLDTLLRGGALEHHDRYIAGIRRDEISRGFKGLFALIVCQIRRALICQRLRAGRMEDDRGISDRPYELLELQWSIPPNESISRR